MSQRRNVTEEIVKQGLPVKQVFVNKTFPQELMFLATHILHPKEDSPKFVVKGQGILQIVPRDPKTSDKLACQPDQDSTLEGPFKSFHAILSSATHDRFILEVTPETVHCNVEYQGKSQKLPGTVLKPAAKELSRTDCIRWFSLDYENGRLSYGQGEVRKETELIEFTFEKHEFRWVHDVEHIEVGGHYKELIAWRDPVVVNTPLRVVNHDDMTMDMAANNTAIVSENLTDECQKLYANICGKHFKIDDDDFPDFSKAVNASINTEGQWCYKKLKEKAGEFGKENLDATYLRITLGKNQGNSPGVPYVMEIWPAGHYSPIHNHGHANAVIRVLHGSIHVRLFSYFSLTNQEAFSEADFNEGEVTFITPELNQTHQLINLDKNGKACVTIQCYLYKKEDNSHYEYFDYINNDGNDIGHFEPDSDMDFIDFKKLMREEWAATSEDTKKKYQ